MLEGDMFAPVLYMESVKQGHITTEFKVTYQWSQNLNSGHPAAALTHLLKPPCCAASWQVMAMTATALLTQGFDELQTHKHQTKHTKSNTQTPAKAPCQLRMLYQYEFRLKYRVL